MNIIVRRFSIIGLAALLFSAAIQPATAAVINWGSPTLISGTGDQVVTTGSLFAAANFGSGTSQTVNGVTFAAFQIGGISSGTAASWTSGNFTIAGTGTGTVPLTNLNASGSVSGTTPFDLLGNTSYRAVAASSAVARSDNPMEITITGLTPATEYLIQYWASDSRFSGGGRTVTLNATNSVTLDVNNTNTTGGLGQWVTGTFTASATSQSILVNSGTSPTQLTTYVNAIQVRVVPEPSTLAIMFAAAGTATMLRLRRSGKGVGSSAPA